MEDTFTGQGLSERLAGAARAARYDRPTALQAAALPVLRRGGNVVLHASSGAGVTAAYGLPLIDRLVDDAGAAAAADTADAGADTAADAGAGGTAAGPRALVLAPSQQRAEAIATALNVLAADTGVTVRTVAPGWRAAGADVLVTTAQRALRDVEASALKLAALQTLVVSDAAEIFALGDGDDLNTLATLLPRDAQRVITSADLGGDVERFVEAHGRRALTVPARAADPQSGAKAESAGQVGYMVVTEAEKPQMLARLLDGADEALVFARTAARAAHVLDELSRRGIAGDDALQVRTASFDAQPAASARVVSYDVPFSADELRRLHEGGGTILVTPAELTHFRRIAAEVPFTLKHRRARDIDDTELTAFRAAVRTALDAEDISAQLVVLEPLFEEHAAAEVAAALSALLRRRAPVGPGGAVPVAGAHAAVGAAAAAGAGTAAPVGATPKDAMTGAFTRLFISIGARDNVRPGDLVGAITGEAGIRGDQVGRVDIRDSFSVVEVAAPAAEKVIRALNGTTMRGRSLRVDFDRKVGGGPPSRDAPRGRGPSRGDGPARSGPPRSGGSGRGGGTRGPKRDGPPRGDR